MGTFHGADRDGRHAGDTLVAWRGGWLGVAVVVAAVALAAVPVTARTTIARLAVERRTGTISLATSRATLRCGATAYGDQVGPHRHLHRRCTRDQGAIARATRRLPGPSGPPPST
jgi:hypothetical protein